MLHLCPPLMMSEFMDYFKGEHEYEDAYLHIMSVTIAA